VTIITHVPNKLWTSGMTTAMNASESRKATKIANISYGRDVIMIQGYHLQRHHFQETNWRIQSIDEIWIIRVFIFKAGTHSMALSQYISIPAQSEITLIKRHTLPVLMAIWNGIRITNGSAGGAHLDVCGTKLPRFWAQTR